MAISSNASGDRQTVREGGEPSTDATAERPAVIPGARIGRYIVLAELGSGAMGQVLMAYDPELDRRVAVKLLHADRSRPGLWLRREAQALARLTHPNVVAVYDVGEHHGRVFVAMEYVQGSTLREWFERDPRPAAREILEAFIAAGEGLAEAHRLGLVHRDFKPDNVMRGDDGRIRVMDFGLARANAEVDPEDDSMSASSSGGSLTQLRLTQTGAVAGTPAYMAPEQYRGVADDKSDQFSFCVALFEGLFGRRPFEAKNFRHMRRAVHEGYRQPLPSAPGVSSHVRDTVLRGMNPRPGDRHGSMNELLAALRDDPVGRRRRWLWAGTVVVSLGGSIIGALAAWPASAPVCTDFESDLAGVWDPRTRDAIQRGFAATGLPYADDAWNAAQRALDEYAVELTERRVEACRANERGRQSDTLYDLRMRCLDDRLGSLRATARLLARAEPATVEYAATLTRELPELAGCDDVEALTSAIPLPDDPARRVAIERAEDELRQLEAARLGGHYDRALELADAVTPLVERAEHPPLTARLAMNRAAVLARQLRLEKAAVVERELYALALEHGMTTEAWAAAIYLMSYAAHRDDVAQARWWELPTGALTRAKGTLDAEQRFEGIRARILDAEGKHIQALERWEHAVALAEQAYGPADERMSYVLSGLSASYRRNGEHEKALATGRRGREILEAELGPAHPRLAIALMQGAQYAKHLGRAREAVALSERAVEIREQLFPEDSIEVLRPMTTLAASLQDAGEWDRAQAVFETVLERLDPEEDDALRYRLITLNGLAEGDRVNGRLHAAKGRYLEVLELMRELPEPDPHNDAIVNSNVALVDLARGDAAAAVERFEPALAFLESEQLATDRQLGETRYGLARALAQLGRAPDRVRRLARDAEAAYRKAGATSEADQVAAWRKLRSPG